MLRDNPALLQYICFGGKQPNGPTKLFLDSLIFFGFSHDSLNLGYTYHKFHLLQCSVEELHKHFRDAWQNKLTRNTVDVRKKQVEGTIDVFSTGNAIKHLGYSDVTLLRTILTLRNNTGEALKHWKPHLANCQHCGEPDNWKHRTLLCPFFQQRLVDSFTLYNQLPLTDFQKQYGWHTCPEEINIINEHLSNIGEVTVPVPFFEQHTVIFIDGSAKPSNIPKICLASGALYFPDTGHTFQFVLPGPLQSSIRAELYSLYLAIKSSKQSTIYSDCSYVVRTFHKLQNCCTFFPKTHADIWYDIKCLLFARSPGAYTCRKVKAHVLHREFPQAYWLSYCNHIVDELAKIANLKRPAIVLEAWSKLNAHYELQNKTSKAVFIIFFLRFDLLKRLKVLRTATLKQLPLLNKRLSRQGLLHLFQ